jgi:hypothetical protein
MQPAIQYTMISGGGVRPSLFGSNVSASRGFHALSGARYVLAQTPIQWYQRAKSSIAKFDALRARTAQIANRTERDRILSWVGSGSDTASPAYRYATVKSDLAENVERFTPPAYEAYQVERRTDRIEKLEAFNREFETMVSNAENVYGRVEPEVIQQIIQPGAPAAMDWTVPALVAGGAVAVAVLLSLIA